MKSLDMTTTWEQIKPWLTPAKLTLILWGALALAIIMQVKVLFTMLTITQSHENEYLPGWFDDLPQRSIYVNDKLLDLFGHYEGEWQVLAPDTTLPLVLKAIFFSVETGQATVAIAAPGMQETTYAAGASLPGGVILYSIETDHVLLQREGRFERLGFPNEDKLLQDLTDPVNQNSLIAAPPGYRRVE